MEVTVARPLRLADESATSVDQIQRSGEQAASGFSGREFCAHRQIAYATFCARKRELSAEPKKRPSGAFVEVALDHDTPAPAWDVEIELGDGVVLRVRRR